MADDDLPAVGEDADMKDSVLEARIAVIHELENLGVVRRPNANDKERMVLTEAGWELLAAACAIDLSGTKETKQ